MKDFRQAMETQAVAVEAMADPRIQTAMGGVFKAVARGIRKAAPVVEDVVQDVSTAVEDYSTAVGEVAGDIVAKGANGDAATTVSADVN